MLMLENYERNFDYSPYENAWPHQKFIHISSYKKKLSLELSVEKLRFILTFILQKIDMKMK